MASEAHLRRLERMYHGDSSNSYYEPRLTVGAGWAEVVIPVQEKFFHAAGAVHGSIYFKALDDAAYFAASSEVEDVFLLTASFNLYLLRPVTRGELRARGTLIHHAARLLVAEARLVDGEGKEAARGSGTFVPSKIPLSTKIGYD